MDVPTAKTQGWLQVVAVTPEWLQVDDSRVVATCKTSGITAKCGDNGEIAKMRKTGDWGNQTSAAAENTGLLRKTKVMVKFAKLKKLRIGDKTLCIAVAWGLAYPLSSGWLR